MGRPDPRFHPPEHIWRKATDIIWLDYDFLIVFSRALSRTLRRSVAGEILYSGNRGSLLRSFFARDSILLWVLTTFRRRRRDYAKLRDSSAYPHLRWIRFRTPGDADRFLRTLGDPGWCR